jgi:predicted membrane channel-forming protein YqfA (hemolysin III family)
MGGKAAADSGSVGQDSAPPEAVQLSRSTLEHGYAHIHTGYRRGYGVRQTLRSVFEWHNETWNIWTHLLGFVLFAALLARVAHMDHVVSFVAYSDSVRALHLSARLGQLQGAYQALVHRVRDGMRDQSVDAAAEWARPGPHAHTHSHPHEALLGRAALVMQRARQHLREVGHEISHFGFEIGHEISHLRNGLGHELSQMRHGFGHEISQMSSGIRNEISHLRDLATGGGTAAAPAVEGDSRGACDETNHADTEMLVSGSTGRAARQSETSADVPSDRTGDAGGEGGSDASSEGGSEGDSEGGSEGGCEGGSESGSCGVSASSTSDGGWWLASTGEAERQLDSLRLELERLLSLDLGEVQLRPPGLKKITDTFAAAVDSMAPSLHAALSQPELRLGPASSLHVERWPLYAFVASAMACLSASAIFHLFGTANARWAHALGAFDYAGIILLILGSTAPIYHYGFYTAAFFRRLYLGSICICGIALLVCIQLDWFYQQRWRLLRIGMFVALGMVGALPLLHVVVHHDFNTMSIKLASGVLAMGGTYLLGVVVRDLGPARVKAVAAMNQTYTERTMDPFPPHTPFFPINPSFLPAPSGLCVWLSGGDPRRPLESK